MWTRKDQTNWVIQVIRSLDFAKSPPAAVLGSNSQVGRLFFGLANMINMAVGQIRVVFKLHNQSHTKPIYSSVVWEIFQLSDLLFPSKMRDHATINESPASAVNAMVNGLSLSLSVDVCCPLTSPIGVYAWGASRKCNLAISWTSLLWDTINTHAKTLHQSQQW